MRRAQGLLITACLLLAGGLSGALAGGAGDAGKRLELQVTTLAGEAFDLAAQRGKWVVVNYWATWCSPCLAEMPELEGLWTARDDVVVIGLAYENIAPAALQAFLREHPVSYPIAIIDPLDPPADFGVPQVLPASWLIDPQGRWVQGFLGPLTAGDLLEIIGADPDPVAR